MITRLLFRTVAMLLMTIAAFGLVELFVNLSATKTLDIGGSFPEAIRFLVAIAILAWVEVSLLWIRVFLTPKVDLQSIAALADKDSPSSMYWAHQFTWAVRIAAFLILYTVQ